MVWRFQGWWGLELLFEGLKGVRVKHEVSKGGPKSRATALKTRSVFRGISLRPSRIFRTKPAMVFAELTL